MTIQMHTIALTDQGQMLFYPRMPSPERYQATLNYFYFGWSNIAGGWLVRRQERPTGKTASAGFQNNPLHKDLNAAWNAIKTLVY